MRRATEQLTIRQLARYITILQLFWGVMIIASCLWNLGIEKKELIDHATAEARISCEKDLLYRRWSAGHGGVYVPVTKDTPPNPYLKQIPERDLITPSGKKLTLINPAYMTRQVLDLESKQMGIQGHITSLQPINPINSPDPWEKKALESIAKNNTAEVIEVVDNGIRTLRYMRRLLTEKRCLKCHAQQGYHEGDVRGGISVSVPLANAYALAQKPFLAIISAHFILWLLGFIAFTLGWHRLQQQITTQAEGNARAESEWNAAMDASNDAIYLLDLERMIIRANKTFYAMTKSSPETTIGRHITELVHPDGEQVPCPICQAQEDKKDFHLVMEPNHPDNPSPVPLEITLRVVRTPEGTPLSMLMSLHDLSHSRSEAEEKERLTEDLRQAQKMEAIGTLAGGIAHDFNNILTAILGYSEMALINTAEGREVTNDLNEVVKAGIRARDLIRQILVFSRNSSHKKTPLRLQLIIKEALKLMRSLIPTTIEINQKIDNECAPTLADPTQIHQVIMNLCTNAYQAMKDKGGTMTVTLDQIETLPEGINLPTSPDSAFICLRVSDTGCGIKKELLEKIFDPYFSTKQIGEGTGLGLSVVQGIIKSCGGKIKVASKPGEGSAFTIYLPTTNEGETPDTKKKEPIVGGSEKIMVIDDDPKIVEFERQSLENLGYRVTAFTSSKEALAAFRKDPDHFDLVFSDMTMPKMTGAELAQKILALRPGIPIIIATGYSDLIDEKKSREIGISRLITKPVLVKDLAMNIRDALKHKDS